ncbi:MAG: hypothetical protein HY814_10225 [Candidatus Riflebacteria bacterium]|nr:hypothetical protein [Candidatus Riflebacteria bacterium]
MLLSSNGKLATSELSSVTSFTPTTSRIHTFEVMVFTLDARGNPTGVLVKRLARILVDTEKSSVPVAEGLANPQSIAMTGPTTGRKVTLDGSNSRLVGVLAGKGLTLLYSWRQVAGPRVTLDNPFAVRTFFVAPDFGQDSSTLEYLFELTVDVTPPGDRSEPVYLKAVQQPGSQSVTNVAVQVFVNGTAISPVSSAVNGMVNTTLTFPTSLTRGQQVTVEQVDAAGNRLVPPAILATYTVNVVADGQSLLIDSVARTISVPSSMLGTPVGGLTLSITPAPAYSGFAGGGGGCARGAGGGALPDLLILALPWVLLPRRSQRQGRRK